MSPPLVSAVMAVHNGERFVADAVESILAQDYAPIELIAVDDGSTDRTAEVIRAYPAVTYVHQVHRGNATARNEGIVRSRGEFIAFLDQDDRWTPRKLSVQIPHLVKDQEVGYCIARRRLFLEPGTERPPWLREELLERDHLAYCPGALIVRRTLFERLGGFDTDYVTSSDAQWFARMNDAGVRLASAAEVLLQSRIHDANQSHATELIHRELARILRESVHRKRRARSGQSG